MFKAAFGATLLFIVLVTAFFLLPVRQSRNTTPKKSYVLIDTVRPTHWSQDQWEILDKYLKRIDSLEERVKELEEK